MICFKDQNTKASCRKVQLQMQCYKWDTINNFGINHLPPRLFNFISYFTILFKWEMHPSRKFILTTVQSAQTMSLKCFVQDGVESWVHSFITETCKQNSDGQMMVLYPNME
jgi:hypothetical protein